MDGGRVFLSWPTFPLTSTFGAWKATFTPDTTFMGFFPTLDITSSPNRAENFPANLVLSGHRVGQNSLGSGEDHDADTAQDFRNSRMLGIDPTAGLADSPQ